MQSQVIKSISAVQAGWSDEERRNRQELAGAMQLHLQSLVVLSELVASEQPEERQKSLASAC